MPHILKKITDRTCVLSVLNIICERIVCSQFGSSVSDREVVALQPFYSMNSDLKHFLSSVVVRQHKSKRSVVSFVIYL